MDSMDLIYTSMFVNTGQKRASFFSPRNFPLPLPKLKAGDKSKPREGDGGSGALEANLVALLTPKEAGEDVLLPCSGQVQPMQSCVEGKGEQSYCTSLWRGLTCAPASQGLICWQVSERSHVANASAWATWGSTAEAHLTHQSQRKEMLLFSLQSIFQQPQPRVRPSTCVVQSHSARQFLPHGATDEQRGAGKKKKPHKAVLFFLSHTSSHL